MVSRLHWNLAKADHLRASQASRVVSIPPQTRPGRLVGLSRQPLRNSSDFARLLARLLASEPVEVFGVPCLTTTGPREVFQTVLVTNAASIILAHDHPSG